MAFVFLFFYFLFFIAGEENFFEKKLFFPQTPIFQKTFREGRIIYYCFVRSTIKRIMFALHQSVKVFSQVFFKKLAGLGRAHKNGAFFLPSFFFCASCAKRKSGIMRYMFFTRGKNYLLLFCALAVERIMFALHPRVKVLVF